MCLPNFMKFRLCLFKILKTKTSRMDRQTDGRTDNVKTVYPPQTQFAGGITNNWLRALNDDYCVNV